MAAEHLCEEGDHVPEGDRSQPGAAPHEEGESEQEQPIGPAREDVDATYAHNASIAYDKC